MERSTDFFLGASFKAGANWLEPALVWGNGTKEKRQDININTNSDQFTRLMMTAEIWYGPRNAALDSSKTVQSGVRENVNKIRMGKRRSAKRSEGRHLVCFLRQFIKPSERHTFK